MNSQQEKRRNPFLTHGYESPKYFCDREKETEKLMSALQNGRNVTLIAPRRMGKTGLIKNVFFHIKQKEKKAVCIYIDVFSTRNMTEFNDLLGKATLKEMETPMEKIGKIISSCRPVISLDALTGTPTLSLNLQEGHSEQTLKEILDYMNQSGRECYIAIDEFQQITSYKDEKPEALLRSHIQFTPNIHFIFSGSSRHLMSEMFLSAKRPFYQSTQMMAIDKIDKERYQAFASHFFSNADRILTEDGFDYIYNRFEGHTWYIQATLNRLYESTYVHIGKEQAETIIQEIVEENTESYQALLLLLTDRQVSLLRAIAAEGLVKSPLSGDFLNRHNLKSASTISAAVKSLTDKELLYRIPEGYSVYDRFMAIWLRK